MTRFFVDHREIESPNDVFSLSQFINCVDGAHLAKNTVVRQIKIDGLPFSPDNMSVFLQKGSGNPFEKAEAVEIFTGNNAEVAQGSVSEGIAFLDRVENVTPFITGAYRDRPVWDSEDLRHLYEGFYWLNHLVDRLEADFKVCPDVFDIRRGCEMECRRKFISTLKQLTESRQKGDRTGIADRLDEDIFPLLPFWREVLESVARRAGVVT